MEDISINGSHIFTPLEPEKGPVTPLGVRVSSLLDHESISRCRLDYLVFDPHRAISESLEI